VHVLDHLTIKDNGQFRVLISLAEWAHKQTGVVPPYPIEELKQRAHMGRTTLFRKLAELEADGLIEREARKDARGLAAPPYIRLKFANLAGCSESQNGTDFEGVSPKKRGGESQISGGESHLRGLHREDLDSTKTQPSKKDSQATLFEGPQPKPSDRFDEFWALCPKKVDPPAARRAWKAALKKASAEVIIAGMQRYAEHCRREKIESKFQKTPGPWLNGERWNERLESSSQQQQRPGGPRIVTDGII
jgi:hypothetical protein